jgi:hypothetical protein
VLTDFHAFEPNTPTSLLVHEAGYIFMHVACCRLTADCRQDANVGQASASEFLENAPLGIIFCH